MVLRLLQRELAALAGLSRNRLNKALAHQRERCAIRVDRGGVRVPDLERLDTLTEDKTADA